MFADNLFALGATGFLAIAFVGLCVGSFLNVVIYRLPVMMNREWTEFAHSHLEEQKDAQVPSGKFNLAIPRSRCPKCNTLISMKHNVPVLSWLLLRGRCSACSTPISSRYPLIEALTGIMSITVIGVFGFTAFGLAALLFTWALIAATFIDFDTKLLPDQITQPLTWAGLLLALAGIGLVPLHTAVIGATLGYLFLWSVYWAFKLLTGKEGMGYGDFKLFAAIGAWQGWEMLPGVILIASVTGLIYAVSNILLKRSDRAEPIAFGPYLAIAGWLCLIFRDQVQQFFFA